MEQLRPLGWKCPRCGSNALVEVTERAAVRTRVDGLDEEGKLVFGAHVGVDAGRPDHYECEACGESVRDGPLVVRSRKDLARMLAQQ